MTTTSSPVTKDFTIRIRDARLFQWLKVEAATKGVPLYQLVEEMLQDQITEIEGQEQNGESDSEL